MVVVLWVIGGIYIASSHNCRLWGWKTENKPYIPHILYIDYNIAYQIESSAGHNNYSSYAYHTIQLLLVPTGLKSQVFFQDKIRKYIHA